MSAALITDVVVVIFLVILGWYALATFAKLIEWSIRRGLERCADPRRPDVDLCEVWRIFLPIDIPIGSVSDYLNLVLALLVPVVGSVFIVLYWPVEYRFHSCGVIQEIAYANWEGQENNILFPEDIVAMEVVERSWESFVKVDLRSQYTIKGAMSNDYRITASFAPTTLRMTLVDVSCASCSGHGEAAGEHRDKLLDALRGCKPDMTITGALRGQEGEAAATVEMVRVSALE